MFLQHCYYREMVSRGLNEAVGRLIWRSSGLIKELKMSFAVEETFLP